MERRSGQQRRKPIRFLKSGNTNIGRRLEDLEFSVFLKMGIFTAIILTACVFAILYIN
ncbi:MAG: hypothetical protein CFH44_00039 [Proteobacteria bacterium]|nr:MAG: hypothetical protein CFH44_00039 [Pseudomonadota bacterium]|tara:strand:- start:77 stop:250 length:174 start_codon:yes stop_codon:yes gene_type:complete